MFLQVTLAEKDKGHLEKLRAFLKSETPVTVEDYHYDKYRPRNRARLTVSGIHLHERLQDSGILVGRPNHTLITSKLPEKSVHHWLRGFFDGDGSASKCKQMWFCGSRRLMAWIRKTLATEAGRNPKIKLTKHTRSNIYYLHYKGYYNAHAVADYLYQGATVWLERKRDVVDSWPEPMSRSERGKRRWLKSHTPPSDSSSA